MRFDLTVNEFTRDLWADRQLEVFGEQFWRPYIHVRDAARAVRTVLDAPVEQVAGEVFNVGDSGENYRKLDLVEEIQQQTDRGEVAYVQRNEDPRDYKVSFDKIADAARLRDHDRPSPTASARSSRRSTTTRFGDAVRWPVPEHRLAPSRSSTSGSRRRTSEAVDGRAASRAG